MNMEKIFLELAEMRIEFPDGFVLGFGQLIPIESGWVVTLKGASNFEGDKGMKEAISIANQTSRMIGGWRDGNEMFWDVVMIFDDEDEATRAGIENNNLFIYQIETAKIKWLS